MNEKGERRPEKDDDPHHPKFFPLPGNDCAQQLPSYFEFQRKRYSFGKLKAQILFFPEDGDNRPEHTAHQNENAHHLQRQNTIAYNAIKSALNIPVYIHGRFRYSQISKKIYANIHSITPFYPAILHLFSFFVKPGNPHSLDNLFLLLYNDAEKR